jgi:hypothetical protein
MDGSKHRVDEFECWFSRLPLFSKEGSNKITLKFTKKIVSTVAIKLDAPDAETVERQMDVPALMGLIAVQPVAGYGAVRNDRFERDSP